MTKGGRSEGNVEDPAPTLSGGCSPFGPFENSRQIDPASIETPDRNFECANYTTCLNLAAALNWDSFTCYGCCQEINQQLLWKAYGKVRNDKEMEQLCDLPLLKRTASAGILTTNCTAVGCATAALSVPSSAHLTIPKDPGTS